jgi:hypothetical protein
MKLFFKSILFLSKKCVFLEREILEFRVRFGILRDFRIATHILLENLEFVDGYHEHIELGFSPPERHELFRIGGNLGRV